MLNDLIIDELQSAALEYLGKHLDKHYTYHNVGHTLEVCSAVKLFAENSNLASDVYYALRIAAVFHDFGYLESSSDNEKLALPYIEDFGRRWNIAGDILRAAYNMVLETVFPYQPASLAGQILCDADVEYIGRDSFLKKAELFRRDLAGEGMVFTEREWWKFELNFLQSNMFFSPACRSLRDAGRLRNLEKVEALLLKIEMEG